MIMVGHADTKRCRLEQAVPNIKSPQVLYTPLYLQKRGSIGITCSSNFVENKLKIGCKYNQVNMRKGQLYGNKIIFKNMNRKYSSLVLLLYGSLNLQLDVHAFRKKGPSPIYHEWFWSHNGFLNIQSGSIKPLL